VTGQVSSLFVVCLFPLGLAGQQATVAEAASRLPVKRVVLYKNGVGYFEHLGRVQGNQDVSISFTSGQLNDVLKSLTALDLDGGRITGVGYGSRTPADRQMSELRFPAGEKSSLTEILGALRGARMEVRSGTDLLTGRLLSVERKTRINGGTTLEVDYLSLIGEGGQVKTTELSPSYSLRLLDGDLPSKMDRYLDLVSADREPDSRRMVISTMGEGQRNLFVSYISEVPVWKATYRIVLGKSDVLLQGWAIVDNTVGQDWRNVQLSLVAGAPHSFIQELSQPYFSRRPVVSLPQEASIAPQTHEAALVFGSARVAGTVKDPAGFVVAGAAVKAYTAGGELVGSTTTNPSGEYQFDALPDGEIRLEIGMAGFRTTEIRGIIASRNRLARHNASLQVGSVSETTQITASAGELQTSTSQLARAGSLGSGRMPGGVRPGSGGGSGGGVHRISGRLEDLSAKAEAAAEAHQLGDLFEYKLREPVTIEKNRSALVPILQSKITAEKVSLWNDQAGLRRPQRALWLSNSSGSTLDGGSFSVIEEETFAGEGVFESIRPEEKRLVSYASDLGLHVSSRQDSDPQRVTRVVVSRGVLKHHSEILEKKTYTFRNENSEARTVIVEHPVRQGYEVRGEARPWETTGTWMRFRLQAPSKQTASLVVEEARPASVTYAVSDLTSEHLALFAASRSVNRELEQALQKILAQKALIGDLHSLKSQRTGEQEQIFEDQQRLRENMKSLKGSSEEKALVQRYTRQLDEQENRLEKLRQEIKDLDARLDKEQETLQAMIDALSFDAAL
jgi:hypothetical protein